MDRQDVIELFRAWRGAGLRPPMDRGSVEQANNLVNSFLAQYSALTKAEVQMLTVRLSRLQFWPRFYDVDEALADYRTQKATEKKSYTEPFPELDARQKRTEEARIMLGIQGTTGKINYVDEMSKQYALKHYPEASPKFIFDNKLNLAAMFEIEYDCEHCEGKTSKDCKYGCHTPFLRVDKYTGFAEMLSDSVKCDKHIENPNSFQRQEGSSNRGGGFSSFGEVV